MEMILPLTITTTILLVMLHLMKFKKKSNTKSLSPFECGYNPMNTTMPMSIQFTLLVFIFLLFDIELSILISSNSKIKLMSMDWTIMMTSFILLVLTSVIYEMMKKSHKWN